MTPGWRRRREQLKLKVTLLFVLGAHKGIRDLFAGNQRHQPASADTVFGVVADPTTHAAIDG
ncbi:hypothetical protein [Mycobacterium sp.]|uniref:hypothetical protein n=1 Tax=Mycobacterium sp. TaxID=1785 RepID=UPI0031E4102F